jgi:hypothetical protein
LALAALQRAAEAHGLHDVAAEAGEALALEHAAAALAYERKTQRARVKHGQGEAAQVDPEADRLVSAMVDLCAAFVRALPADHPIAQASGRLLTAHFAGGAAEITQLPYAEQLSAMQVLLERLTAPDSAADVATVGLAPLLAQLSTTVDAYRTELEKGREGVSVSNEQVQTAFAAGHARLCKLVLTVLARTWDNPTLGNTLLAGVIEQQERMAKAYSARLRLPDVDPNTGAELEPA